VITCTLNRFHWTGMVCFKSIRFGVLINDYQLNKIIPINVAFVWTLFSSKMLAEFSLKEQKCSKIIWNAIFNFNFRTFQHFILEIKVYTSKKTSLHCKSLYFVLFSLCFNLTTMTRNIFLTLIFFSLQLSFVCCPKSCVLFSSF